jgi:iron complex outermembrane recepter protein
MFVNDANSESAPGYAIFSFRFTAGKTFGRPGAELTAGIQNLFDRKYASSVSVNAAAGKYFEPGSGRSAYLGLTLRAGTRVMP